MADSSDGNAMTEIALALAMAFFSIMVLTMVSMSATPTETQAEATPKSIKVAANKPDGKSSGTKAAKRRIVVFWNGRFLDDKLQPVTPESLGAGGRIVLALAPDLPMTQAIDARARFRQPNVTVSTLDGRWLTRLQQTFGKEHRQ